MKFKYSIFLQITVVLSAIVLGMAIYKHNWFPIPQYRNLVYGTERFGPSNIFFLPYSKGTPLFSDRVYHDIIGDERLKEAHVIQIPRHGSFPIKIKVDQAVTIFRILSPSNDNSSFSDWEQTDINVMIKGASCTHKSVVKKQFEAGAILLSEDDDISSSPILIRSTSAKPINSIIVNGIELTDNYGFMKHFENSHLE